ncbi:MAG: enoyl-CoA hydratase/isomerase family protein [Actinomycetota bacterium]
MTTDEPLVLVDRPAERVARVRLNRPERRNALTGPLAVELGDAVEALNHDDAVSVIVIGGAGGAFCSGLDLKAFNEDPQPDWVPGFADRWQRVHRVLFDSDRIVVGALERAAVNGGAALALACDFLVAGDESFLQVGEIQQGMAAPMNMAWLRLRHSEAVAARVALLGDRINGPELVTIGLAHRSVPDAEVWPTALELAGRLAANDPTGSRRIKTSLRRTAVDDTAEQWFQRAIDADPLAGRRLRPIAARDT